MSVLVTLLFTLSIILVHFLFKILRRICYCPSNFLIIKDFDIIHDICVDSSNHFSEYRRVSSLKCDPMKGKNMFPLLDPRWKYIKKLVKKSFVTAKLKILFSRIDDCAREYSEIITKEFEAKEIFGKYTRDVTVAAIFDLKINSLKNPDNEFCQAEREISQLRPWKMLKLLIMSEFPELWYFFQVSDFGKVKERFLDVSERENYQQ